MPRASQTSSVALVQALRNSCTKSIADRQSARQVRRTLVTFFLLGMKPVVQRAFFKLITYSLANSHRNLIALTIASISFEIDCQSHICIAQECSTQVSASSDITLGLSHFRSTRRWSPFFLRIWHTSLNQSSKSSVLSNNSSRLRVNSLGAPVSWFTSQPRDFRVKNLLQSSRDAGNSSTPAAQPRSSSAIVGIWECD